MNIFALRRFHSHPKQGARRRRDHGLTITVRRSASGCRSSCSSSGFSISSFSSAAGSIGSARRSCSTAAGGGRRTLAAFVARAAPATSPSIQVGRISHERWTRRIAGTASVRSRNSNRRPALSPARVRLLSRPDKKSSGGRDCGNRIRPLPPTPYPTSAPGRFRPREPFAAIVSECATPSPRSLTSIRSSTTGHHHISRSRPICRGRWISESVRHFRA